MPDRHFACAKKMDWTPRNRRDERRRICTDDAVALVKGWPRALSVGDCQSLMHLSGKTAQLTAIVFASFAGKPPPLNTVRPAAFLSFASATLSQGSRRQIWTHDECELCAGSSANTVGA